ncbi:MAG: glycosyltransferase family 2 protein [Acidimicrobiia bacterium]
MFAVVPIGLQNAPHMSMTPTRTATVATIVIANGDGGLVETVAAVRSQVYETPQILAVGSASEIRAAGEGDVGTIDSLSEAVDSLPQDTEYVWILREGAIARPDTLSTLVADADRTGAGIAGSKIVSDDDALVAVGLVTDVFGVPYSGLDASERDQGQYDVVRDVAAIAGVSMLIRRDLFHGLGGVDEQAAPLAASVDICQRARLKGARVVISPASEVLYRQPAEGSKRWREEASRIRSYAKVYSPLTLLWVLPLEGIIGFIEAVMSVFLGRWFVFDYVRSLGWNVIKIPSTVSARRSARRDRAVSDSELFRFQRRGSVKLSTLSHKLMSAIRRRLPGDDTLTVESIGSDMRQPAFVVGVFAVIFVLLACRNIWGDGLPAVGYTLPFPSNGWDALAAYAGGWNPAGLGSAIALRPLIAIAAIAKILTLHSPTLAEYILTAGAMLLGIWGTMRLLRTWSIGAAPGLIAGIVYVAGPTAQGVAGNTHLGTLLALGLLPWALRLSVAPLRPGTAPAAVRIGSAVLLYGLVGALSPLLLLVPLPAVLVYALLRFNDAQAWKGVVIALVGTAGGALLLSPWLWDHSFEAVARAGYAYWHVSLVLATAGAVVAVAAVLGSERRLGLVAAWGALLAASGFLIARAGSVGLGTEAESVGLVVSGLGLAVTIGVVAETVSQPDLERWRRFVVGVGAVGIVVLLVAASVIVLGGRAGLPGDRFKQDLAFTMANEGEAERSRVLLVGPAELMPGDSRSVAGGSYRVVSAPVPDLGEPRLEAMGELDIYLRDKLALIIAGDTRRAGAELAAFGIRWIVILGDSDGADADEASLAWRRVFAGQLDLLPLSAGITNAVFVSDIDPVGRALTSTAASWAREGWTYQGEPEEGKRVFVADNPDPGFGPPPLRKTAFANEVAADLGVVTYKADAFKRIQAIVVALVVILGVAGIAIGRRR